MDFIENAFDREHILYKMCYLMLYRMCYLMALGENYKKETNHCILEFMLYRMCYLMALGED